MNKQRGLSLIELMVAILIASILILGVTSLFTDTSDTARTNTALARVQESGRLALELMGADARRAGYVGCQKKSSETEMTVGTVEFPRDALTFTATSLTFRYGGAYVPVPGKTPVLLPLSASSCPGLQLELYAVTYANCPQGGIQRICLNGQPMLENARIDSISLAISPDTGTTTWKDAGAAFTPAELLDIDRVRIAITVTERESQASSSATISRSFSGTYHMRNRS